MKVGAFNVLNFFLKLTGPDARGATSPAQLDTQAAKIVTAIEALDADVTTLMEIEDTNSTGFGDGTPDQAVANLVSRLNTAAGFDKWGYSPLPDELLAVDRDVIRNAIIYQQGVVAPVGDPVGLVDESVWFNAREPIAQTFVKDGDRFTVIANHLKSKSNTTPPQTGNDNEDIGDGQGAFNGDRTRQAASLAEYADDIRRPSHDKDVLIFGDLNAYTEEDPMQILRGAGSTDLGSELDGDRYSYVFNALSGSLDHAMSTAALTDKVTGFAHWNINAVESLAYEYGGDPALYAVNPFRSSDHDPLVLGINLEERCLGLRPTIMGTDDDDVIKGTNKRDVIMGFDGDDVIKGWSPKPPLSRAICAGATSCSAATAERSSSPIGGQHVLPAPGERSLEQGPGHALAGTLGVHVRGVEERHRSLGGSTNDGLGGLLVQVPALQDPESRFAGLP